MAFSFADPTIMILVYSIYFNLISTNSKFWHATNFLQKLCSQNSESLAVLANKVHEKSIQLNEIPELEWDE